MRRRTRVLTVSAALSALTVVTLYLASVFSAQRMSLPAVASLFVAAAVIEGRIYAGLGVYGAGVLLGLLLLPDKAPVLLFAFFFGLYPVVKSLAERTGRLWLALPLKLVFFILAFLLLRLLFSALFAGALFALPLTALLPLLSVVFLLYDFGLSRLIAFYMARISRHIKK